MPSHCGIASGLNLIPNNKKIFHLANDRLQSIPVAHLVVDGRRKLMEPPQFNQPILAFSEPTVALFNQELTDLFNFLALESMGFQPYFAYGLLLLAATFP